MHLTFPQRFGLSRLASAASLDRDALSSPSAPCAIKTSGTKRHRSGAKRHRRRTFAHSADAARGDASDSSP